MATPIKRNFPCTIAELYAICRICWNSCSEYLADFTAFKSFYNALYVTTALAEVEAAEQMPDEEERDEASKTFHIQLQEVGHGCILQWLALRAYILSSFAPEFVETKLEAAGQGYYEAAYTESWENMQQLMSKGQTFISNNTATLTAGGMPAGFSTGYDNAFAAFTPLYNAFKNAQQEAEVGTLARLNANNELYDRLKALNSDGKTIFRGNQAKYNRFVFARVKALVTPPSGETILNTFQHIIGAGSFLNEGLLTEGTNKIRITLISNGAIEAGLSADGMTYSGNTVTVAGVDSPLTFEVSEFVSAGNILLMHNQNSVEPSEYKVEYLA